jgi:photosystem II stability/assembly factor-like uncharacterized protein
MFLPTISPHDSNVAFVACDMTGSYLTKDGGAHWRMFNLRGRTSIFVFDPGRPGTMYAYGLGLFRSTDGGERWALVYPPGNRVRSVGIAGDHGDEFILTKDGDDRRLTAFAVDPEDSKTLYAAMRNAARETTLEVSTDEGQTWRPAGRLGPGARAIYVDPRSPRESRTLYVAGESAIMVRERGVWKEGAAVPGGPALSVSGGFSDRGGPPTFYAATQAGLSISTDGGQSWHAALPGLRVRAVSASLHHPETAYVSYGGLRKLGRTWFGVARTNDSGKSWTYGWEESSSPAANVDVGGWISSTFGPGWGENPLDIGASPTNPEICYATDFGRTLNTADGGKSWVAVYTRKAGTSGGYTTRGLDVTTAYGVHFDPFDPRHMFISYTDIGLMRSDDGGGTWRSAIARGVPRAWSNTTYWVQFDPEVKGRVWAVMSGTHDLPRPKMWRRASPATFRGGVCRSDDGGATWTTQTSGMPETAATHIVLDPRSPKEARVLYVAGFGKGVFKSTDGGATWALRNNGLPGIEPFAWRLAQASDGTLYVVLARRSEDGSIRNDRDGGLYRSRNGAGSWEKVALPEGVNGPNGLAIDPGDPKRLYLAVWGRKGKERDTGGGIYLSTDGGGTWKHVLSSDAHIYDVTVDPRHPERLYASGFESSVWRSGNRGQTWGRVPGYNFKWGHRVIPDPADTGMIYVTTFGGSVWHGPAAGDPNAMEDLVTPALSYRAER